MRCPLTVPYMGLRYCPECNGYGVDDSKRQCEHCEGRGEVRRERVGHLSGADCDLCGGSMALRADLAEWVAERVMAAMSPDDQRAIVTLHNAKQLREPPRARDELSIVFVVKNTRKADRLVKKLFPGAIVALVQDDLHGTKVLIAVAGPSVEEIRRRTKEVT